MPRYAALVRPSANRVYAGDAARLMAAELAVVGGSWAAAIATETIAGVEYVGFVGPEPAELDAGLLGRLSSVYAVFRRTGEALIPVPLAVDRALGEDVVTIQRYPGKTNEQFTALLLGVTLAAGARAADRPGRRATVLDPMCGRGTTLNHALRDGRNASGIEREARDFDAYAEFLLTYLRDRRIKHEVEIRPGRGRRTGHRTRRLRLRFNADRDAYRAGEAQLVDVVCGDAREAGSLFADGRTDAIVLDAPYGIQHTGRGDAGATRRNPVALIAEAAPGWARLLAAGGALGVAFNTLVCSRDAVAEALGAGGLRVIDGPGWDGFAHRVDRSIVRDLVVARRVIESAPG